jgi:20S proteasome subunit beta 5
MGSVYRRHVPIDPIDPSSSTDEDLNLLSSNTSTLPSFSIPPVANPTAFLRTHIDDHANPDCRIKLAHGTTTLAFRFDGGIVVAVDSRATAGSWIASQSVKKGFLNPYYSTHSK